MGWHYLLPGIKLANTYTHTLKTVKFSITTRGWYVCLSIFSWDLAGAQHTVGAQEMHMEMECAMASLLRVLAHLKLKTLQQ